MEQSEKTIAEYVELASGMSGREFIAHHNHPVLVEKVGVFPHQSDSLMSGTMVLEADAPVGKLVEDLVALDMGSAKVFPLKKKPGSLGEDIFVGRAPTNDIVLPSSSVSKSHANFTPTSEERDYELVDMFSSNGTFVNGEKIHPFEKHPVKDHDEISFGPDYVLIYYSPRGFYELLRSLRM
ncbi:MAG: FHA domain-containing protein [Deltaproteobacteria bacterium]|nr:FHA domain-containing protein [Deltaproteobacteria bacterium]